MEGGRSLARHRLEKGHRGDEGTQIPFEREKALKTRRVSRAREKSGFYPAPIIGMHAAATRLATLKG